MSILLSHQEKLEMAAALKERFLAKDIDSKQLIAELRKLRLSLDEIGEIAKEAIDVRNNLRADIRRDACGVSPMGRPWDTPQDRKDHEASVVWLENYKKGRADGRS